MRKLAFSAVAFLRSVIFFNVTIFCRLLSYWKNLINAVKNVPLFGKNAIQIGWHFLTTLIGSGQSSRQSIFSYFEANSYLFQKQGIWNYWLFNRPVVILSKPETAQALFKSNNSNIEKSYDYKFFRPFINVSKRGEEDNVWQRKRKSIIATLHEQVIEGYLPIFDEQSRVLVRKIKELKGEKCDFLKLALPCTLDIVCETSMGTNLRAQKEGAKEYVEAVYMQLKICSKRILKAWLWPDFLFRFSSLWKRWEKSILVTTTVVSCMVKQRKQELIRFFSKGGTLESALKALHRRLCFLDLLLDLHIRLKSLSLEDVIEEVNTIVFNSHDSTALNLSFALYLLGLNPQVQSKVHQELDTVFGPNIDLTVGSEQLRKLTYLDCIIKETLRLYPSGPMLGTQLSEELTINGITIPKYTNVHVFLYGVHRDPDTFKDPETFIPERFFPENAQGRNPYAFFPYSNGKQDSIGSNFAMQGVKTILVNILRNFSVVSLQAKDKMKLSYDMVIRPKSGVWLKFLPRRKL